MQLLLIDNYDSFTYNLAQYFGELGTTITVLRNDRLTLTDIRQLNPDGIVISPGPGTPEKAGITLAAIREFAGTYPMLGVCLGHQAIARAFGGRIVRAPELMHGKTSQVFHDHAGLFNSLSNPFTATRYHSLIVEQESFPEEVLEITARTANGVIMGLAHRQFPIVGVQFHPESFLTEYGKELLNNFLKGYIGIVKK